MKYQLVIFDMDGLMIDSEAKWAKGWQKVGDKYGYDFGPTLFNRLVGISGQPVFDIVQEAIQNDPTDCINEAHELGLKYLKEEGADLKPGLLKLLDYLDRNGYKKAVATTSTREMTEHHLNNAGIFDRFDYILCGDEVTKRKPDPEIYLSVLNKFNLTPSSALVLEDSPHGVSAAYNAGIDCIMIPDLIFPTIKQQNQTIAIMESLDNVKDYLKES